MRSLLLAATLLVSPLAAHAQLGVGVAIDIGIRVPVYPQLVLVPGYPVYYAPSASTNYFFYDGLYWVFQRDGWYASSWYDGPWYAVAPEGVPLYVLRVPVRYYRHPPAYFHGWRHDAPPRWGERFGHGWERRHHGWDRWDRRAVPRAAPLPAYQREYSGDRYPRAAEQQQAVRARYDRYRPRDATTRQHLQPARATQAPGARDRGPRPQDQGRAGAPSPQRSQAEPSRRESGRGSSGAARDQDRDDRHGDRGRGERGRDDRDSDDRARGERGRGLR